MKVIVSDHVFENFDAEREILAAAGAELAVHQCKSAAELATKVDGADGILNTYLPGIDGAVFDAAPRLRAVVRYGIGLDTIDIPEATRRGIVVANVPDYCIDEVADHAMAHFLALARKVPFADRKAKAGEWSLSYVKPLKPLRAMRAGILGFGRIGRALARRLAPFVGEIAFHDPRIAEPADGAIPVPLDELFAESDAIFVQCPATPATRHLVGAGAFAKMRRKPILINCARGPIVDTDALVSALDRGLVSAAGLDVLEDHGHVVGSDHPLKNHPHVLLTPHSAWFSDAAIPTLQRRAAEAMATILSGKRPETIVNPEALENRP